MQTQGLWAAHATLIRHGTAVSAAALLRAPRAKAAQKTLNLVAKANGYTQAALIDPVQSLVNAPMYLHAQLASELSADDAGIFGPAAHLTVSDVPDLADFALFDVQDIAPLDRQMGVTPPKPVPDTIDPLLFSDIRRPETSDPLPHGTFALLDAAAIPALVERLSGSGLDHRCLFSGKAAQEYADTAPYIVRLERGNSFTRHLFAAYPDDRIQLGLWPAAPGIFLRSDVGLVGLHAHFRRFTMVMDEESGKRVFFRFYAPETLRTLIANMAAEDQRDWGQGISVVIGSDGRSGVFGMRRNWVAMPI